MKRRAIKELMKLMEAEVADIPEVGGNLADNDTTESFGTNPALTWQEVRNPTIPAWYRPADSDEFPIGTYIKMKSGKIIQNIFKLGHSWCHYYSDVEALLKKFQFKLVYSAQHFEPGEKNIGAKNFYEIEHETGILLMLTAGYPIPISGGKIDPKSKIYIQLISNLDVNLFDSVRNDIIKMARKPSVPSNNVNLVITTSHGYDTEPFTLPKQKIDIELNYGKSFTPVHKKIIDSLNKHKSKGLVLLHGDPGTGKTHYLKYIASKVKNKKVLFIPPYLADFITSPEMTPFLIDNANSVLFIEDAERVITDRSENGSTGVSNILNITDGILSDILNIQIVATFNMDRQKIDPALLRKGRLIAEHKFQALSIDDSNKLLNTLGIDYTATKPMTLTEIYNCKDSHYTSEPEVSRRPIGFSSHQ